MSQTSPVRAAVIGCGTISDAYFTNGRRFEVLEMVGCADMFPERARAKAEQHGVRPYASVDELLADPEIELVINLTIPKAHAEVALATLSAGKHAYSEKPFALSREDGRRVLDLARERGLLVGCAPDTFLGGGIQTCRVLMEHGAIGEPVGASAFMVGHGPESWHPDPAFYYQAGGGPMLDMGPYYLTALVSLIGPVRRVTGSARITFPERTITSEPKRGQTVTVEVPTHVSGSFDFAQGAVGTLIMSFDVWASRLPRIEIYGTEGTLLVPDPNTFGGEVHVRRHDEKEWRQVPLTHPYTENSRGIGAADLAAALREERPPRASGELAYHVLDLMLAFHEASEQGRHVEIESTAAQPAPLPEGLAEGKV